MHPYITFIAYTMHQCSSAHEMSYDVLHLQVTRTQMQNHK
jgi:hypothetical protein